LWSKKVFASRSRIAFGLSLTLEQRRATIAENAFAAFKMVGSVVYGDWGERPSMNAMAELGLGKVCRGN
jgi:hypothetical protein